MAGDESAHSDAGPARRLHAVALRAMLEIFAHWFAAVCGQDPGHTWAPGGILLPCCQRCTGLYVGAGVAALLHLLLRPRLSGRFLEIHGAFLLAMVPFGFHWVGQGPVLRTLTGVLFGSGVVTFLWLPLSQMMGERTAWSPSDRREGAGETSRTNSRTRRRRRQSAHSAPIGETSADCRPRLRLSGCLSHLCRPPALLGPADWLYLLVLGATLLLLPTMAMVGGVVAAYGLSSVAVCGALALFALVGGDLILGLVGALRLMRRLARPRPQP
jgi:uncharacterized membrane protein